MHLVEQGGAGIGRAAKPVAHFAMLKMRIDIARMHERMIAHKGHYGGGLIRARFRPGLSRCARMHERVRRARQEAVIDEEIFFDEQARIAPLKIAGAVVAHAVAQDQILRAGGRADRVGLHKAQTIDRARQRDRCKERARHRIAAQVGKRDRRACGHRLAAFAEGRGRGVRRRCGVMASRRGSAAWI